MALLASFSCHFCLPESPVVPPFPFLLCRTKAQDHRASSRANANRGRKSACFSHLINMSIYSTSSTGSLASSFSKKPFLNTKFQPLPPPPPPKARKPLLHNPQYLPGMLKWREGKRFSKALFRTAKFGVSPPSSSIRTRRIKWMDRAARFLVGNT